MGKRNKRYMIRFKGVDMIDQQTGELMHSINLVEWWGHHLETANAFWRILHGAWGKLIEAGEQWAAQKRERDQGEDDD